MGRLANDKARTRQVGGREYLNAKGRRAMSKRGKSGEWVWLKPLSGFVGESNRLKAEIQPEVDPPPCMFDCGDPDCREWQDLWTEPDPKTGKRYSLCHVSECEMHSEKQTPQ